MHVACSLDQSAAVLCHDGMVLTGQAGCLGVRGKMPTGSLRAVGVARAAETSHNKVKESWGARSSHCCPVCGCERGREWCLPSQTCLPNLNSAAGGTHHLLTTATAPLSRWLPSPLLRRLYPVLRCRSSPFSSGGSALGAACARGGFNNHLCPGSLSLLHAFLIRSFAHLRRAAPPSLRSLHLSLSTSTASPPLLHADMPRLLFKARYARLATFAFSNRRGHGRLVSRICVHQHPVTSPPGLHGGWDDGF